MWAHSATSPAASANPTRQSSEGWPASSTSPATAHLARSTRSQTFVAPEVTASNTTPMFRDGSAVVAPPVLVVECCLDRQPTHQIEFTCDVDDRHGRKEQHTRHQVDRRCFGQQRRSKRHDLIGFVETELRVEPFDRRRQVREQTLPLVPQFFAARLVIQSMESTVLRGYSRVPGSIRRQADSGGGRRNWNSRS